MTTNANASTSTPYEHAYGGFDRLLGLRLIDAGPDGVTAELVVRPELLQPYGILHGGVLCSLVETVGSVAGALWFGDRGQVVGVANSTNFLRAVREGATLAVTCTPIQRGRTQQLWSVEIRDGERLSATGQLRLANLASTEQLGR